MKEILLCKYGEIVLKGANRAFFENLLCKELKFRADRHGEFSIYRAQSTIYIEPLNDGADIDGMLAATLKVFGIVGVSRAAVCAKDMEAIKALAREYIPLFLDGAKPSNARPSARTNPSLSRRPRFPQKSVGKSCRPVRGCG